MFMTYEFKSRLPHHIRTVILIELPFFFISPPAMKKPLCSAVFGLFSHDYIEKEMLRRIKLASKHLFLPYVGKSNRVKIGKRVKVVFSLFKMYPINWTVAIV